MKRLKKAFGPRAGCDFDERMRDVRQLNTPWTQPTTLGAALSFSSALALMGCAYTNTATHRDVQYAGHPTRLFIMTSIPALGSPFSDEFERLLRQRITACSGAVVFHRLPVTAPNDALALSNPTTTIDARRATLGKVMRFAPDATLIMTTSATHAVDNLHGNNLDGVTIDLKLWDVTLGKPVWAGVSQMTFAPLSSTETRARSLYEDLASKLGAAGLIPNCSDSVRSSSKS
jgi:hypothetical protein